MSNLAIKSANSPQDSYSLKDLKSVNVFLNNSVSAWCSRKQRAGGWVTLDLGRARTINALTTSGYPVGTEPGFKNFTLQISGETKVFLNYMESSKTKVLSYSEILEATYIEWNARDGHVKFIKHAVPNRMYYIQHVLFDPCF